MEWRSGGSGPDLKAAALVAFAGAGVVCLGAGVHSGDLRQRSNVALEAKGESFGCIRGGPEVEPRNILNATDTVGVTLDLPLAVSRRPHAHRSTTLAIVAGGQVADCDGLAIGACKVGKRVDFVVPEVIIPTPGGWPGSTRRAFLAIAIVRRKWGATPASSARSEIVEAAITACSNPSVLPPRCSSRMQVVF